MLSSLFALTLQFVVVFAEPEFPVLDVSLELVEIPGATVCRSVGELEQALVPGRVLVWRHGSTFPAELWGPLVSFLEDGGSMLVLGGEPFTRPVTGVPRARVIQPRTVSLLKALRLNQCYRMEASEAFVKPARSSSRIPEGLERQLEAGAWVSILEPRLSDTKDFASEDGAPGSRDGIVRPLLHLFSSAEGEEPTAAAGFAIDRLRGRFAGGRWVFYLVSEPPTSEELEFLLGEALRPARDFRLDPTFGCFRPGERPSLVVRLHRPAAKDIEETEVSLEILGPMPRSRGAQNRGSGWSSPEVRRMPTTVLRGREHGLARVDLQGTYSPGLYRVQGRTGFGDRFETGFWVFDKELFRSGDALSFDGSTLLRNGAPEPVMGTTIMSRSVHRKFLFEPNVAEWDDSFAELASFGGNLVRTGIWSAFRKISLDPHVVDEAWLRALEAYYLTARRNGIPILFTFFAFVPESFGGVSPYFDPRSIEGQRAYVSAVVSRFSETKEMLWDLINEPSFASPDRLWLGRPHGDPHEKKAFVSWLESRYGGGGEDWEAVVRSRHGLLPDESIDVPTEADFAERQVMEHYRPFRAKEYLHFAQDAFANWIREMVGAIRDAGSEASVTVGQDEGGLSQRPNPLFHHRELAYTSIHTWWLNDSLLWDGLLAKGRGTPLLVSETGVMQRELLTGESIRTPQSSANLLSRKIGYAFAAGAFGMIQWCYHVNPYMASDNEVAIGAIRVDGSYKPEHEVLRTFSEFFARNREAFGGTVEADVVLVWPATDTFPPRVLGGNGTRRSVEILVEQLGVDVQVVPEPRLEEDLEQPLAIVLPACRGLSDRGWRAIMKRVSKGSVLLCSGWFERDDAGRPKSRLGVGRRGLAKVEGEGLVYPLGVFQSAFAADHDHWPRRQDWGRGVIHHYPVPLEWSERSPIQERAYRSMIEAARVGSGNIPPALRGRKGLFVRAVEFDEARLLVIINETSKSIEVTGNVLGDRAGEADRVAFPPQVTRMILLDKRGERLDSSHPLSSS